MFKRAVNRGLGFHPSKEKEVKVDIQHSFLNTTYHIRTDSPYASHAATGWVQTHYHKGEDQLIKC